MFFMFVFTGKDNSAPYILFANTAIELITIVISESEFSVV